MHPEQEPQPSKSGLQTIVSALYAEAGERLLAKQEELRQLEEWPHVADLTDEEEADVYFDEQSRLYRQVWLEMAGDIRTKAEAIRCVKPIEDLSASDANFLQLYVLLEAIWLKDGLGWPPP